MTSSVPLFWTQETSVWLNLRVYTHTDTKRDLRDVLSPFLVSMYLLMYTSNHSCETSVRASVARLYTHVTTFTYGFFADCHSSPESSLSLLLLSFAHSLPASHSPAMTC